MISELVGIEFDWFAIDELGELALFATAGEGLIPSSVQHNHFEHAKVSDALAAPHWGTAQVWDDYAAMGLFVYDWARPGGPYERRAVPSVRPSSEMRKRIEEIAELPHFSFIFSSTNIVNL